MRTLVQPPPSLHCDLCHGEIRLKQIDPDGSIFGFDTEIFVCVKCGHEKSYRVSHDPYVTYPERNKPPANVG
jgi:hypothetical protein